MIPYQTTQYRIQDKMRSVSSKTKQYQIQDNRRSETCKTIQYTGQHEVLRQYHISYLQNNKSSCAGNYITPDQILQNVVPYTYKTTRGQMLTRQYSIRHLQNNKSSVQLQSRSCKTMYHILTTKHEVRCLQLSYRQIREND